MSNGSLAACIWWLAVAGACTAGGPGDGAGAGGADAAAPGASDGDDGDDGDADWTWDDEDDGEADSAPSASKRVRVRPGATRDAELVETLPVGRGSDRAERKVVLRLEPADLPALAAGDRLIAPAEVQVTTRCDVGQTAAGCDYNPNVSAQLILTGTRGDADPHGPESKALSAVQTLSCTKADHHCMFVFRPRDAAAVLEDAFALPCVAANACYVNLVMWAWHRDARSDGRDRVLVGGNEGNYLANGVVDGDKARLMVVRERGLDGADRRRRETGGGGALTVPTDARPVVVFSHRLRRGDLKAGEQYLVEAKLVTDVSSRARFSTLMFLTKDPKATEGNGLAKTSPSQIGEHNGINCTGGSTPCTTRKVAVFEVTGDISGPVYVNVVSKSAVPGGGGARVTVRRGDSWVRSTRYRATLR